MKHLTDTQAEAPEARGRAALEYEPRAIAARYNRKTGRVTVDLANGCAYVFPADLVQDLSEASPDELANVEVDGVGFNLHWPKLDTDIYVPALVAGVSGTKDWMSKARVAAQASRSPNE